MFFGSSYILPSQEDFVDVFDVDGYTSQYRPSYGVYGVGFGVVSSVRLSLRALLLSIMFFGNFAAASIAVASSSQGSIQVHPAGFGSASNKTKPNPTGNQTINQGNQLEPKNNPLYNEVSDLVEKGKDERWSYHHAAPSSLGIQEKDYYLYDVTGLFDDDALPKIVDPASVALKEFFDPLLLQLLNYGSKVPAGAAGGASASSGGAGSSSRRKRGGGGGASGASASTTSSIESLIVEKQHLRVDRLFYKHQANKTHPMFPPAHFTVNGPGIDIQHPGGEQQRGGEQRGGGHGQRGSTTQTKNPPLWTLHLGYDFSYAGGVILGSPLSVHLKVWNSSEDAYKVVLFMQKIASNKIEIQLMGAQEKIIDKPEGEVDITLNTPAVQRGKNIEEDVFNNGWVLFDYLHKKPSEFGGNIGMRVFQELWRSVEKQWILARSIGETIAALMGRLRDGYGHNRLAEIVGEEMNEEINAHPIFFHSFSDQSAIALLELGIVRTVNKIGKELGVAENISMEDGVSFPIDSFSSFIVEDLPLLLQDIMSKMVHHLSKVGVSTKTMWVEILKHILSWLNDEAGMESVLVKVGHCLQTFFQKFVLTPMFRLSPNPPPFIRTLVNHSRKQLNEDIEALEKNDKVFQENNAKNEKKMQEYLDENFTTLSTVGGTAGGEKSISTELMSSFAEIQKLWNEHVNPVVLKTKAVDELDRARMAKQISKEIEQEQDAEEQKVKEMEKIKNQERARENNRLKLQVRQPRRGREDKDSRPLQSTNGREVENKSEEPKKSESPPLIHLSSSGAKALKMGSGEYLTSFSVLDPFRVSSGDAEKEDEDLGELQRKTQAVFGKSFDDLVTMNKERSVVLNKMKSSDSGSETLMRLKMVVLDPIRRAAILGIWRIRIFFDKFDELKEMVVSSLRIEAWGKWQRMEKTRKKISDQTMEDQQTQVGEKISNFLFENYSDIPESEKEHLRIMFRILLGVENYEKKQLLLKNLNSLKDLSPTQMKELDRQGYEALKKFEKNTVKETILNYRNQVVANQRIKLVLPRLPPNSNANANCSNGDTFFPDDALLQLEPRDAVNPMEKVTKNNEACEFLKQIREDQQNKPAEEKALTDKALADTKRHSQQVDINIDVLAKDPISSSSRSTSHQNTHTQSTLQLARRPGGQSRDTEDCSGSKIALREVNCQMLDRKVELNKVCERSVQSKTSAGESFQDMHKALMPKALHILKEGILYPQECVLTSSPTSACNSTLYYISPLSLSNFGGELTTRSGKSLRHETPWFSVQEQHGASQEVNVITLKKGLPELLETKVLKIRGEDQGDGRDDEYNEDEDGLKILLRTPSPTLRQLYYDLVISQGSEVFLRYLNQGTSLVGDPDESQKSSGAGLFADWNGKHKFISDLDLKATLATLENVDMSELSPAETILTEEEKKVCETKEAIVAATELLKDFERQLNPRFLSSNAGQNPFEKGVDSVLGRIFSHQHSFNLLTYELLTSRTPKKSPLDDASSSSSGFPTMSACRNHFFMNNDLACEEEKQDQSLIKSYAKITKAGIDDADMLSESNETIRKLVGLGAQLSGMSLECGKGNDTSQLENISTQTDELMQKLEGYLVDGQNGLMGWEKIDSSDVELSQSNKKWSSRGDIVVGGWSGEDGKPLPSYVELIELLRQGAERQSGRYGVLTNDGREIEVVLYARFRDQKSREKHLADAIEISQIKVAAKVGKVVGDCHANATSIRSPLLTDGGRAKSSHVDFPEKIHITVQDLKGSTVETLKTESAYEEFRSPLVKELIMQGPPSELDTALIVI